jgi:hypothetical protein
MKAIIKNGDYSIEFNGSRTWFVNINETCVKYFDTEKKAINYFNRLLKGC